MPLFNANRGLVSPIDNERSVAIVAFDIVNKTINIRYELVEAQRE